MRADPLDMRALCEVCGVDMGAAYPWQKFCGAKCRQIDRRNLERAAKAEAMAKRPCRACGGPIDPLKKGDSIYCGRKCIPRRYRETRTCPACGKVYRIIRRTQTFCSKSCAKNSRREGKPRPCTVCGAEMAAPLPEQKYCSATCNHRAYRRRRARVS